jgi:hypothetical protein
MIQNLAKLFAPDGPLSMLSSRKAWVAVAAIAAAGLMLYLTKINSAEFLNFVQNIVTLWIGAIAVEKSALYLGPYPNGKAPDAPTTQPTQPTTQPIESKGQ